MSSDQSILARFPNNLSTNRFFFDTLLEGTYSHAYEAFLIVVRKRETNNPEVYKQRNERFKKEFGIDIPPLPEKYAHENTSLMMVDFSLAILGKNSSNKLDTSSACNY